MTELLNLVAWLACIVYSTIPSFWLAIHPRAKYWRSRRRSPYRVLLPLWIAMWIVAGLVTATWRHVVLYSSLLPWVPAVFLFGGGIPEVMAGAREQRLITAGIHNRVRHPVYLAHFCEMLAWSLGTGLAVCYALTAFALLSGAVMTNLEDKELEQRFGEDFRQYKSSVPAMFPRLH